MTRLAGKTFLFLIYLNDFVIRIKPPLYLVEEVLVVPLLVLPSLSGVKGMSPSQVISCCFKC